MIESFFFKSTRKLNFISKLSYNLNVFEHSKEVIKNQSLVVRVAYCIDFTDRARCLLPKFAKNFVFNNDVLS